MKNKWEQICQYTFDSLPIVIPISASRSELDKLMVCLPYIQKVVLRAADDIFPCRAVGGI